MMDIHYTITYRKYDLHAVAVHTYAYSVPSCLGGGKMQVAPPAVQVAVHTYAYSVPSCLGGGKMQVAPPAVQVAVQVAGRRSLTRRPGAGRRGVRRAARRVRRYGTCAGPTRGGDDPPPSPVSVVDRTRGAGSWPTPGGARTGDGAVLAGAVSRAGCRAPCTVDRPLAGCDPAPTRGGRGGQRPPVASGAGRWSGTGPGISRARDAIWRSNHWKSLDRNQRSLRGAA